ncbi:MAG: TonB-dependent receptor [Gammaproteobacteria bacterium]|nr:TonB-dependent receptor [Gammaproteobacteria bacterium]
MYKTTLKILSAAVLASSVAPSVAIAQQAALALEEVIVTARKREETIQTVPVAVTALTQELQRSSVRNLQDIQQFVPNLLIDKVTALQGGAAIAIRGVSYQEIDKSLDPGIGVLIDGVYLGTNSGQILENFDIERMEVLRGPQGTLFGKNTIGGAINIIRTKPTREWGARVQGTWGDFGRQDIRGVFNAPLNEDGGLKVFASKLQSDGHIYNTTYNDDAGGQDYQNLGATIDYDFTDNFNMMFTYERIEDHSEVGAWANFNKTADDVDGPDFACSFFLPDTSGCSAFDTGSDEDNNSQNAPNNAETTNDFYNLTFNYTVGDWTLTSITGYINRNEFTRLEYDANAFEFLSIESDTAYEQFSQELRVSGSIGDVELTTGLYYWDSEYDAQSFTFDLFEFLAGLPEGSVGTISQHGETESLAVFASADWSVTDRLTLNLGGRYTYEEKLLTPVGQAFLFADGSPLSPPGDVVTGDDDYAEFSPRIGVQYDLTDSVMAYASYSEGFKSGGFFGRITSAENIRGFDPETVETYEVGLKSTILNDRLRMNLAIFSSEYKDKQEEVIVADPDGNVDTVVLNASDASMDGAELEVTALLFEGLTFFGQAGYLDAGYDEFLIPDIPGIAPDGSALEMRNTPEFTFGAGLSYVHSLFQNSEMSYNVNYSWRDEYVTIFNNDPLGEVDALGFWNANIDYRFADDDNALTISVYGRNLGDERYRRAVLIPPISSFGQYNEPQNFGVTLTYEF